MPTGQIAVPIWRSNELNDRDAKRREGLLQMTKKDQKLRL